MIKCCIIPSHHCSFILPGICIAVNRVNQFVIVINRVDRQLFFRQMARVLDALDSASEVLSISPTELMVTILMEPDAGVSNWSF